MSNLKKYLVFPIVSFVLGFFFANAVNMLIPGSREDSELPSDCAAEESFIYIELGGAVNKPGVYRVEKNSRLKEVVDMAEGFSSDYDYLWTAKNINLSKTLEDAEKVFIPFASAKTSGNQSGAGLPAYYFAVDSVGNSATETNSSSSSDNSTSSGKTNVNSATLAELDELPGVGAVYAQKILDNRPYSDYQDLMDKAGLSQSLMDKIKDSITF